MKIGFIMSAALSAMLLASCSKCVEADYQVVPMPKEISIHDGGGFVLNSDVVITYSDNLEKEAEFLSEYINDITGLKCTVSSQAGENDKIIRLSIDKSLAEHDESYRIVVNDSEIAVTGSDAAGVFYGIQTLRKSLPMIDAEHQKVVMPAASIYDYPRFGYRGMHLDPARHFFTIDSVKIYIDMLAMHNINTFHFHITDDQGWRMEIKQYPELTQIGAYRNGTVVGHNSAVFDTVRHGGFYTQDELRDLVQYAADRHITVIPEIDLPGHMQAALATYPEMGCKGDSYEVWQLWGVSEDVLCVGNEKAMIFLENVLNEVMDVFPSEIIHIGGDECPKTRWYECPKCQAKIKELGIKGNDKFSAEDFLQSYVMNRMEKLVESRGRRVLGWDEILDGDVAEDVIIMSWRGEEGGVTAARKGHDVVMVPCSYLYFDYYQSEDVENEPLAIGGYVPVENVYNYEPVPTGLTSEQQKHILGVQANIWTEYIKTFRHVQYMALPRMAALSEIQWSLPEQKNYDSFVNRCFKMARLYDLCGYNYAKHIFDLKAKMESHAEEGYIEVVLSKYGDGEIRYSLDGSDPMQGVVYTEPVHLIGSCDLRAVVVREQGGGREYKTHFDFSKSTMKPLSLTVEPHRNYAFDGASTLNDGLRGNGNYRTGRWLGFWESPCEAIIDLQDETEVGSVNFDVDVNKGDWMYNPKSATVFVSDDGVRFEEVAHADYPVAACNEKDGVRSYNLKFNPLTARYVKVSIEPHALPEDHQAYGYPAWLFVDEIGVE